MMRERISLLGEKLKSIFPFRKEEADPINRMLALTILGGMLIMVVGYWYYNSTHLFTEYKILKSAERKDIEGTRCLSMGNRLIKYGHDGVFCVGLDNEPIWSQEYSMHTPLCDVCSKTVVLAELQGNQVYVLNDEGVLGSFRTQLPILQAHVSSKGVTALVLRDEDVTWINLYSVVGGQIASIKTTVPDSGYPLDVAISPDARRMLVSYAAAEGKVLEGRVSFYDFSTASGSDESHLLGTLSYEGVMLPDVLYAGTAPAALTDSGFIVFTNDKNPREKTWISFDDEIISAFYDDNYVGFIHESGLKEGKYRIHAYSWKGRQVMDEIFDFNYQEVRMDRGEILFSNPSSLYIYRISGKQKLQTTYEKEVLQFMALPGVRRYLVVTDDSFDQIGLR